MKFKCYHYDENGNKIDDGIQEFPIKYKKEKD